MLVALLDELCSPRTSPAVQHKAIRSIERIVADVFLGQDKEAKAAFIALQDSFQVNLACHLLPWISQATRALDALTKQSQPEHSVGELSKHLGTTLNILQAVSLNHQESKLYLTRRHSLETLLDLLLISRHAPPPTPPEQPLTSIVIDTLLSVLVDAPAAIRVFEAESGLPAVVKILKRAGTPREVRMKCLEFLYFYLLDEKPGQERQPVPATPSHRRRSSSFSTTPPRPTLQTQTLTNTHSRLRSQSQSRLVSPTPLKRVSAAQRLGHGRQPSTSSLSSSSASRLVTPKTHPQLMMLRKPVDFIPLSPRKPFSGQHHDVMTMDELEGEVENDDRKTTEEKKEMLGRLLGNVDALVDGVRKAGVWGLG